MLHITRDLAKHCDVVLDGVQRASSHARRKISPDYPQQFYDFRAGNVLVLHGNPKRGRGGRYGMLGSVSAADIDEAEAVLRGYDLPGRFVMHPYADKSFATELAARGYRVEYWMQVLVRQLDELAHSPRPSEDVQLDRINADQADLWAEVMCEGFRSLGYDYLVDPDFHLPMAHIEDGSCYLARVDGQWVGAACLVLSHGWGCLFTSSTVPGYRNRGIQTAFIQQRLADARAAGCTHAMILTDLSSGSQRNAERAGFQIAYTLPTMIRDWE